MSQAFDEPTPRDSKVELMFRRVRVYKDSLCHAQQQVNKASRNRLPEVIRISHGHAMGYSVMVMLRVTNGLQELQLTMELAKNQCSGNPV